jgi:hypothetical protein
MCRQIAIAALAMTALIPVNDARAQASTSPWRFGTVLSGFVGSASTNGTDPALAASVGWEMTPYFTLEARGLRMTGPDVRSMAALIGPRFNLLGRRRIVPFVSTAIGVQNASVRVDGTDVPTFYRGRVAASATSGGRRRQSFDDLGVTVGSGVDVFVTRHVALRPDAQLLLVHASGRSERIGVFGIHLAYHFEEHNVTPFRR